MQTSSWHVLHVLSNHEKRVSQHLSVRSVEHYLPVYKEKAKWTDRTVVAERPLFSGYIFARVTREVRVPTVSVPGVLRLLGDDEHTMVSDGDIEKIREGLASGLLLRPHPSLTVGTRVRVRDGVFSGKEGVVTELRQSCKVILSLEAINQSFSLEVDLGALKVIEKPVVRAGLRPQVAACG